jgi:formylglycine-generating enzyme required for sulfatase activity
VQEKVFPVFDWSDDPEALTQFIFRCKPRGIGVEKLLDLLDLAVAAGANNIPKDTRYAILLALGEYEPESISPDRRTRLVSTLADWYLNDPSSGVHGASGWLLRHLGEYEIAKLIDQTEVPYSPRREWFTIAVTVKPTDSMDRKRPKVFYYTFVVFARGSYVVGSREDQPHRNKNEIEHLVKLSRPFALLDREITFEELISFDEKFSELMSDYNSESIDAGFSLNWYDSVSYCRWLGTHNGLPESQQCYDEPGSLDNTMYPRDPIVSWAPRNWPLNLQRSGFRLPTESEWEIAAKNGARTAYGFGSDSEMLNRFGWFLENSSRRVHPPKQLLPSIAGLYDMHSNLFEWTHDWFGDYEAKACTDPMGADTGEYRVLRGGSWSLGYVDCRSSHRGRFGPSQRDCCDGFRIAISLDFS